MLRNRWRMTAVVLGVLGVWLLLLAGQAQAVPSFARQTGMDCTACHTVFPELTPFGRTFKLTGYTLSKKSDKPYEFPPPISAAFLASFTNLAKPLPQGGLAPNGSSRNDNVNVPQEMSLFYAGRIVPYVGAFVQGTYDGVSTQFLLDHADVRFAYPTKLWSKSLVLGITMNNAPTAQDVLNTVPAWGFPWAASSVSLTPAAAAVIDGGLDQQVGGFGGYFYWNNLLYGELTFYRTTRTGFTQFLGAGTVTETVVDQVVPYWRVFLQHQWKQHSFALGTFGLAARIFPPDQSRGPTDHFTDVAVDAQYQFLGKKHLFTAQTLWIHEFQHLGASFGQKVSANRNDRLDTYRVNLNYYYRSPWGTLGGTAAYFTTWGTRDTGLYAPSPGGGSRAGYPNSNGFIVEGSYLPWKYTKITVQYTIYNKFNGAETGYDGTPTTGVPHPRNARENNTLYILIWQMI